MATTAIVACGGIFCRKLLAPVRFARVSPFCYLSATTESPLDIFRNETIA
tara:strand:+ start:85 stop:234 length:150 start_codon:yes stop_codon:yes gene_type:complete